MYDHFKSLYSNDTDQQDERNSHNDNFQGNAEQDNVILDEELDKEISYTELKDAVFSQNNSKSSGLHTLIAEIYKHAFARISRVMLLLFNKIYDSGKYPSDWGTGVIIPIFKGGDADDPKNYRGITLNNIISKIYSQILLNRLTKWSNLYSKIIDNQFGFQKNKSTIDCIFLLHSIILKSLYSRKKLYCAFVDFEKCFDRLNRFFIFQKLSRENVSSKFVLAIKNMYNTVKAAVRFNSDMSSFFNSNIGVKQGDPSSTILFLYFINDIIDSFDQNIDGLFKLNGENLFILLFADDTVLFAHTPTALQSLLNDLQNFCQYWGLKINTNKTKVMIFELGRYTNYNFVLNENVLEVVTSFKYLGINLFKNGNLFRSHKKLAQHASFALHNLFVVLNQLNLNIGEQCCLFDSLVGSVLNYGAEIFGTHEYKSFEHIHCKFLRKILGVKKSTNLDGLYGETARYPMLIHRKIKMFKFWIKIIDSENDSFIKCIYNALMYDAEMNNTYNGNNWAYQIKSCLYELGLNDLWLYQNEMQINLSVIKTRILDVYKQVWHSNINNSRRLAAYCSFKNSFEQEKYLETIKINKYRIALSKFRLSSHKLRIESGRHEGIGINERICTQCNMHVIEDEFHFLLVCPKYYNFRTQFLKPYYYRWPTLHKFQTLLSSQNTKQLFNLSKFIYTAFNVRV